MTTICLRGFDSSLFRRVRPCKAWNGSRRQRGGYGYYYIAGNKIVLVHRETLAGKLGRAIDAGYLACHHCDNPPCYEPQHLYEGTRADNMQDMQDRGRHPNTSPILRRRLTPEQEADVRSRYSQGGISQAALGAEYGVTQRTISNIVRGHPRKPHQRQRPLAA